MIKVRRGKEGAMFWPCKGKERVCLMAVCHGQWESPLPWGWKFPTRRYWKNQHFFCFLYHVVSIEPKSFLWDSVWVRHSSGLGCAYSCICGTPCSPLHRLEISLLIYVLGQSPWEQGWDKVWAQVHLLRECSLKEESEGKMWSQDVVPVED
jgi:hypothetical protein